MNAIAIVIVSAVFLIFVILLFMATLTIYDLEKIKQNLEQLKDRYEKLKISKKAKSTPRKVTATQPKPQQPAAVYPVDRNDIEQAIFNTFWVDSRLLTLVNCESGFDPQAIGYDASHNQYNYGLFQISQYHGWSHDYLINPYNNIKAAKVIYDRQGFYAWPSCSKIAGLL